MGTIIEKTMSEVLLAAVESSVKLGANISSQVTSDSEDHLQDSSDLENTVDDPLLEVTCDNNRKLDSLIHTAITVETVSTVTKVQDSVVQNFKRFSKIIDSDDSEDENVEQNNIGLENKSDSLEQDASPNEQDESTNEQDASPNEHINALSLFFDSDSDTENTKPPAIKRKFCTRDSDDMETLEHISISKKSMVTKLCDSETSEDETTTSISHQKESITETSTRKLTGKEAQEQRREISSESQRRLREARVSLPYHKPKPRTLSEFLQRRPKIAQPISNQIRGLSAINAIKVVSHQADQLSKTFEERGKAVEAFYNSGSDSENEEAEPNVQSESQKTDNTSVTELVQEKTQDISTNNSETSMSGVEVSSITITETDPLQVKIIEEMEIDVRKEEDSLAGDQEGPFICLRAILEEMGEDINLIKNDLIKSFLQPSKLTRKLDIDSKTFEEQDVDTELISGIEISKLIDTLNSEDSSKSGEAVLKGSARSKSLITDPDKLITSEDRKTVEPLNEFDSEIKTMTFVKKDMKADHLSDVQLNKLVEKYSPKKNSWADGKCFDPMSDSDEENGDTSGCQISQTNTEINKTPKPALFNSYPKLSGRPDDIIDLNECDKKVEGVDKLLERFVFHTARKPVTPQSTKVRITTAENGVIKTENILVPALMQEENSPLNGLSRSGTKLQNLKQDLEKKMWVQQHQERVRREEERKALRGENEEDDEEADFEEIYKGEKNDCGMTSKAKSCDENDECEDADVSEEDDENEEEDDDDVEDSDADDDIRENIQKLTKSVFVDDEAEESDEGDDKVDSVASSDATENDLSRQNVSVKYKKRSRIKTSYVEDSDSDEQPDEPRGKPRQELKISHVSTKENDANKKEKNKSGSEDEQLPPRQPAIFQTPNSRRSYLLNCQSDNSCISPVQRLTALQDLQSPRLFNLESPKSSLMFAQEPSPLRDQIFSQKQLYYEGEPSNTQENITELMDLCSGKFTGPTQNMLPVIEQSELALTPPSQFISTLDFENKNFTNNIEKSPPPAKESDNEDSQNLRLFLSDNESDIEVPETNKSPKDTIKEKNTIWELASSSEDEVDKSLDTNQNITLGLKKRKKFDFSDDDHSAESDIETLQCDGAREDDSDDDIESEQSEQKIIDYDSEENEILVLPTKVRGRDFFDAEAELSEDEHEGSADENEDGLDEMDREEGDNEKFNERKMQRELERIHLRQVLDKDKREVRLLQEILLEDGELHSEKSRQRQFRWKNVTDIDNDENVQPSQGESDHGEDFENDAEQEWRKTRYEREKFLRERSKTGTISSDVMSIEIEESENDILKLGQTVLRRSISSKNARKSLNKALGQDIEPINNESVDVKKPLGLLNARGSFLRRGENALARIANLAKASSDLTIGGAKNSRNFVFTTVEPKHQSNGIDTATAKSNVTPFNKKRRLIGSDNTPLIFKKLRMSDSLDQKIANKSHPNITT